MNAISVKNYRSINESPTVELKSITVLVGKNSAGKSSFIRLFPLLKQTLERKIAGSLLWYGDYVDFGDFSQAVSKAAPNSPIVISFDIEVKRDFYYYQQSEGRETKTVSVELTIEDKEISKYVLCFFDQCVEIVVKNGDAYITINGDNTVYGDRRIIASRRDGNLLPTLFWESRKGNEKFFSSQSSLDDIEEKLIKYLIGDEKKNNKYRGDFLFMHSFDVMVSKKQMLELFSSLNKEKFLPKTIGDKTVVKYNNLLLAFQMQEIISRINDSISVDMQQTSYIKPIRAMVNRYYRLQGLRVDELDADGSNLPMILKNMSTIELRRFEVWSKEKFGVVFSVVSTEGHISMVIRNDVNDVCYTNVADTGYGYSQMLPIVMLLWMIHNSNKKIRTSVAPRAKTVLIEQPELHLHPAFQAKLIDVFANVIREAKSSGIDIKIIFETHSETMINRIGALIENGQIKESDVNVLVFDKQNDQTIITSKSFDSNGLLLGWPADFFAPEEWL